jgi:hypothetical protein
VGTTGFKPLTPLARATQLGGRPIMKKLLIVLGIAATGLLIYRKVAQDRAELDLWAEVTDPVE